MQAQQRQVMNAVLAKANVNMSVRGILFDAGDTLYAPIGGRWNPRFDFEEALLRYHPEVQVDRFAEAFAAGKRFMDTAPSTPPRDDYHRAILSELGIPEPSSDLLNDLNRPLDVPVVVVFPEVASVLAKLKEREIRMAIVSDNWGDLEQAFVDLGLREFFDVFVVSEAMGCCKPDPRMYRAGSDGLGLAPSECLFVDDDPDLVLAATHLGYRGIAIDRYGSVRRPDVEWIENLTGLWPFLGDHCS
jgi:putative hydrolase of the HAD superfamily